MLSKTLAAGSLLALVMVVLLVYNYGELQASYADAQANYELMKLRYDVAVRATQQSYRELEAQYRATLESLGNLSATYAAAQFSNDQLSGKAAAAERENALLQVAFNAKSVECGQFQASLAQCLSSGAQSYQRIEDLEGNVLFKGGNATVHFYLGNGSKHYLVYDVGSLNYYINEGYLNRRIISLYSQGYPASNLSAIFDPSRVKRFIYSGSPQPTISLATADGKAVSVMNYMAFKDTAGVLSLADYLKGNSASDADFVRNVLYVKSQLNDYTYNIRGQPRYPLETFLEGGGDCGASSIFVGSVIKAAHPDWAVQLWLVDSDPSSPSVAMDHFIVYASNGRDVSLYIETTAKDPDEAMAAYGGQTVYGQSFDF